MLRHALTLTASLFMLVLLLAPSSGADTPAPKELSAKELDALWDDLAGDDAKKAWVAINTLARNPKQAVPLFKERLKPVAAPDAARIDKLIKDLDAEQFPVRQKAEAELEKIHELAEPALKKALEAKPPLEVAKRLEGLRTKIGGVVGPGEKLRAIRAIESLEMIGNAEALEVLKAVAAGAAGARITQEAQSSVERLNKRAAVKP